MPSEYLHTWLIDCKDQHGYAVNVGVGISEDGNIVLVGPPDAILSLAPDEATRYILMLTRALKAARQST